MTARRFEYTDDKSSKFWQVTQSGTDYTVVYGKIGSDGQTKTKSFDDEAGAKKEVEKLIAEKTKKGYVEVK